jgi:hypothetical protein
MHNQRDQPKRRLGRSSNPMAQFGGKGVNQKKFQINCIRFVAHRYTWLKIEKGACNVLR